MGLALLGGPAVVQPVAGQQAFTTPGLATWPVPPTVTRICVVAVGGGGGGASNGMASAAGGPGAVVIFW